MLFAGQICSRRNVNRRTRLSVRLWLLARLSTQEGSPGTGQISAAFAADTKCSAPSSHFCYMTRDPLDLTGVNPGLREGWAFTTDPKHPPTAPPTHTQAPLPLLHPTFPGGHRKTHYKPASTVPNTTPSPRRPGALLTPPPALDLLGAPRHRLPR